MMLVKNKHGEKLDIALHEGDRKDCLVIIGHGVTGNKDRPLLMALAEGLSKNGWPCLRMSFSGNGESEGDFADATIHKEVDDLTAVLDQLGTGKKIAYIGHSMGGAVGTLTAARNERIKVLISLAGMVDTVDFYRREFGDVTPGEGNMWDEPGCPLSQAYVDDMIAIGSTLSAAASFRIPWLLFHGTEDDVVLPKDSEDLIKIIKEPKDHIVIEGAGHSFEGHEQKVLAGTLQWLEKHLK